MSRGARLGHFFRAPFVAQKNTERAREIAPGLKDEAGRQGEEGAGTTTRPGRKSRPSAGASKGSVSFGSAL
eukprot:3554981-Pyramimonas_sp.AAC.1